MATPLGHSIVGYAVARALGVKSRTGYALAMGAASLPDIDLLAGYVQNGDVLSLHHEVITHKPIFPILIGGATAVAVAGLSLLRGRRPEMLEIVKPAALATALVASHVAMDHLPLPYDKMPTGSSGVYEAAVTRSWNAVVDLAVYGLLAVLTLDRNGSNGHFTESKTHELAKDLAPIDDKAVARHHARVG